MSLISVIIPIYKVEKYVERCIKSVVEQTYENLEIILVEDGSLDNCPVRCDNWAMKDSRIKVIHKENGGLSDARNAGLAIASGDYVGFVDGDDYINPLMYEILMKTMIDGECDITSCQFQTFFDGEEAPQVSVSNEYLVLNRKETMSSLIENTAIRQVVWNKLYSKSLVEDIPFLVGKYHEDEFWSYQVMGRANKVAVVDYIGYNYLQRKESIMGVHYSEKRLDAIEAKVSRQQYLQKEFPELASKGKKDLLFSCLYQGQLADKRLVGKEQKKVFSQLKQVYSQHSSYLSKMKGLSATHKMWLWLAKYMFRFTCKLRNCCNVGM